MTYMLAVSAASVGYYSQKEVPIMLTRYNLTNSLELLTFSIALAAIILLILTNKG